MSNLKKNPNGQLDLAADQLLRQEMVHLTTSHAQDFPTSKALIEHAQMLYAFVKDGTVPQ